MSDQISSPSGTPAHRADPAPVVGPVDPADDVDPTQIADDRLVETDAVVLDDAIAPLPPGEVTPLIDESAVVTSDTDAAADVVVVTEPDPVAVAEPDDASDRAVITRLAGAAARSVTGVYDLGGAAARAVGALRQQATSQQGAQGVSVRIDDGTVAVAITLVADYPADVLGVVADVRSAVMLAIVHLVGERPTGIDVTVADIHVPSDDETDDAAPVAESVTV